MKKIFVPAFIVGTVMLFSMSSCKHQATTVSTTFDSIVVDRHECLMPDDTLSPSCDLKIHLKYVSPVDSIDQLINEQIVHEAFNYEHLDPKAAVDSFVDSYINKYRHDLLPYYSEDAKKGEVGGWYNYQYELNGNSIEAKDSVWGYQLELISYEGGAHGSHIITYMNFDKATGRRLTLADVFADGYEQPLSAILLGALQDKLGLNSLDEIHDNGFLTWTDMYPSKNFLLTPTGIKFYYNAYEIAPYSAGPTELELSYETLKDLLKTKE